MARPNVQFRINDESLVVPITEQFSATIGAVYNATESLKIMGTSAEQSAGFFYVQNNADWYSRLTNLIYALAGGITFYQGQTAYTVGSCAATFLDATYVGDGANGILLNQGAAGISSGHFGDEWYPIYNFLQYGGSCYVGFGEGAVGISQGFYDLDYQVMFEGGSGGGNYLSALTSVVDYKKGTETPCIGVVTQPSVTTTISSAPSAPSGTSSYDYIRVYGEKLHLDMLGNDTVETNLAADIAGCLVRTDRDAYPWFSPAGTRRGRILNVVRLARTLTATEQDILYDAGFNPVVTFPGDGTLLYGDKTGETATSTLSRINVSRLFMYIKRALAPVARSILFEQNDSITRSRFKVAAEGFLDRIVGQRGISEYRVICDTTNNTPEIIEANYFVADILIKPVTSINYVTITLTNKDLSDSLG